MDLSLVKEYKMLQYMTISKYNESQKLNKRKNPYVHLSEILKTFDKIKYLFVINTLIILGIEEITSE